MRSFYFLSQVISNNVFAVYRLNEFYALNCSILFRKTERYSVNAVASSLLFADKVVNSFHNLNFTIGEKFFHHIDAAFQIFGPSTNTDFNIAFFGNKNKCRHDFSLQILVNYNVFTCVSLHDRFNFPTM